MQRQGERVAYLMVCSSSSESYGRGEESVIGTDESESAGAAPASLQSTAVHAQTYTNSPSLSAFSLSLPLSPRHLASPSLCPLPPSFSPPLSPPLSLSPSLFLSLSLSLSLYLSSLSLSLS